MSCGAVAGNIDVSVMFYIYIQHYLNMTIALYNVTMSCGVVAGKSRKDFGLPKGGVLFCRYAHVCVCMYI